jgi:type IV pilus assembly protein PilB
MFNEKELKSILKLAGVILDDNKWQEIITKSKEENSSLENYLNSKNIISPEALYQTTAKKLKLPFIALKDIVIRKDVLFLISEPIAQTHRIISFDHDPLSKTIKVATSNPDDIEIIDFIKKKYNNVEQYIATPDDIKEVIKQYHKSLKAEFKDLTGDKESENGDKNLKQLAEDLPVIRVVDTLLEYAVFENASDIHIEPSEKNVSVRYRIDGILNQVMTLPKNIQSGLVARIKVLAKLKLDEHRLPQDGRFTIQTPEYKVSLRVSILPVYDGEKIVMRILNESAQVLTLENLGFQPRAFDIIKNNISKPHGMILVTGPTGSGKTTTLYTVLTTINKPDINISTIEDPIEYHVGNINQSQVNAKIGFTFASGLRALLRQDPNVIMVGEIRDEETAEIAVNAAMTGHLVLSTLHTNDAITTIPRFSEMGVPTFLIGTTINVIIAQRLVRKVCPDCIESYKLSPANLIEIEKIFNVPELLSTLIKEGVITKNETMKDMLFYRGKGCKKCGKSGYKGRLGIYEVLEITDDIKELINKKASESDIEKSARDHGMIKMFEDGVIKAKKGITSLEEVLRVSKE